MQDDGIADIGDFVIDPTKIGPFGVCFTCFTPRSHEVTFCEKCGKLFGFLETDAPQRSSVCKLHPGSLAVVACALCGNNICSACIEREGFSLLGGMPTPQCRNCVERMEELKAAFEKKINIERICAKHSYRAAIFRCVGCQLPHCESCLYFTTSGWLRTKLRTGPLCLACFRIETVGSDRKRWMSLREAKEQNLLRGIDPSALL
jgi:hypothetical protein